MATNIKTDLTSATLAALDAKEKSFIGSFASAVKSWGNAIGDQSGPLSEHCAAAYNKGLADRHYKPLTEKALNNLRARIEKVLVCARAGQIDKAIAFTEATRKKVNAEFGKGFSYEATLLAAIPAIAAGTSQAKFVSDRTKAKEPKAKTLTTKQAVEKFNKAVASLIEAGVTLDPDLLGDLTATIEGVEPAKKPGKSSEVPTTDALREMLGGAPTTASDDEEETPTPTPAEPDFEGMDPAQLMHRMLQMMNAQAKS